MDQWVPIINLPERWTLTSDKNVSRDEFYLHTKRDVNPDGHRLPSIDQIPKHCWFGGEENSWKKRGEKKTFLSVWDDVFKGWGGKKSRGLDFHRTVWSCIFQPWQLRWDGEALVSSQGGNGVLFFFSFLSFKCDTGWTQYRRILSCVCLVKASVTEKSEKCGETRTWSRWVDQGLGLSLQKQSTRWNTGPTAVSLVWLKTVNVHFAVVIIYILKKREKKGRATHPVKTFCVSSVSNTSWLLATSEIVPLLQFKLFLIIFKCIYVSFFIYIYIKYL